MRKNKKKKARANLVRRIHKQLCERRHPGADDWAVSWERILTPERRAAWLLEFTKNDLTGSADIERLGGEVEAFLTLFQLDPALRAGMRHWPFPQSSPTVTETDLKNFHGWLADGWNRLLRGEKWKFPVTATYEIGLLPRAPGVLTYRVDPKATDVSDMLKAFAYETVRDARKRLKQCGECSSLFVPRRCQRYCSTRCAQRVHTRTWRKNHPDKVRAARSSKYEREVKKKTGLKNPRIARRTSKSESSRADI